MALQDQAHSAGWPFGLQPLSLQLRLEEFRMDHPSLVIASSPSFSSLSSSGLETIESTTSFFRDKSITLASLIGFSYGNSLKHSTNSSHWHSTNSCSPQGMWFPHYNRNSKNKRWLTGFWNLLSCRSVKQKQDWWFEFQSSPPSLAQILNSENSYRFSARNRVNRVFTNGVYDDWVHSSLHGSDTSLDPLDARASDAQGGGNEQYQIIRAPANSANEDKSRSTGGGCIICLRTFLSE